MAIHEEPAEGVRIPLLGIVQRFATSLRRSELTLARKCQFSVQSSTTQIRPEFLGAVLHLFHKLTDQLGFAACADLDEDLDGGIDWETGEGSARW